MHSSRMTTTDMLSPQLPPGVASLTSEEHLRERARLRAGCLKKLSRLILWSPNRPYLDPSSFSVVAMQQLKNVPEDITAENRLSFKARTEIRHLEYSGTGIKIWKSAVFARCEEHVTLEEAEEAVQRVLDYYEHYTNKGGEDKLVYTPEEAFAKCVRRWPDAIFDCYTFPKFGEKYVLRKVRDGNKNDKVLYAISAPSGEDTMSDSEEEDEDEKSSAEEGVETVQDPTEEGDDEAEDRSDEDTTVNPEGDTIQLEDDGAEGAPSLISLDQEGNAVLNTMTDDTSLIHFVQNLEEMGPDGDAPADSVDVGQAADDYAKQAARTRSASRAQGTADSPAKGGQGSGGRKPRGGGGAAAGGAGAGGAGGGGGGKKPNQGPKAPPADATGSPQKKKKKVGESSSSSSSSSSTSSTPTTVVGLIARSIRRGTGPSATSHPPPPPSSKTATPMGPPQPPKSPSSKKRTPAQKKSPSKGTTSPRKSPRKRMRRISSSSSPSPPPSPPMGPRLPPLKASERASAIKARGGRKARVVKGPGATTATPSTSTAAPSTSAAAAATAADDDDDTFDLVDEGISCGPGCSHESMSRTQLRKAAPSPEVHMMMVYQERCTTARQNQLHKMRAEQLEQKQQIKALVDRLAEVEKDAKKAAKEREVDAAITRGKRAFQTPWRTIEEVQKYCEDPEYQVDVVRFIHLACSDNEENFIRDSAWKLFEGHLIGHLYTYHPRGYDRDKPIVRHGEECWVLPLELMNALYDRLIELGKDAKKTITRAKAVDRFYTFYEARRTDQGHIAMTHLYRREPTDEVAYWVLVDDEESLGVVKDPAPFHAYHTQEQKEEWLDEYRDRIRNRYIAKRNRDPPMRHTVAEGHERALKEERKVRTRNYAKPWA